MMHTPGPWEVRKAAHRRHFQIGDTEVYAPSTAGAGGGMVAELYASDWPHGWDAGNARLIAAAPDMRAALADLLEEIGSVGDRLSHGSPLRNDCETWCERIRVAIAKAEG